MVAFQDDLPSGDGVDPGKISPGLLHIHAPGQIAQQDRGIIGANDGKALFQLLHITHPGTTKNIHWLLHRQR